MNIETAKTLGIVSVVLGAVSAGIELVGGLCCGWIIWPLAIAAIILGILALVNAHGNKAITNLGWIGIGLSVFVPVWQILAMAVLAGSVAQR